MSLLEQEFEPHYNAWKSDPNPSNTGHLVKALSPVVDSAIRSYAGGPSNDSPTLRSKAKLMIIKALKNYDPSRAKLRTHMMSQLQGLRRASAKEGQILSIPEQVAIDLGKLNESENFLRDKLNRDPSVIELADHTGISKKRIQYVRSSRPTVSEGAISNIRGAEGSDKYSPSVQAPQDNRAWQDFVYHDLEPIDQIIMEHSLGLYGKRILSNQDVAKRLNLSPGAISQRKARIQSKLDQREELGVL